MILKDLLVPMAESPGGSWFTRQRLGFDPNPQQELTLRGGRRGIVNCTQQWGKSTVAAAKAVHRAYCRPDSLILVLAPSERQSGELMRKAEEFVSRLGIKVRGDGTNEISNRFSEPVADCGAAAQGNDGAGIFQSIVDADRRGVAGGRQG